MKELNLPPKFKNILDNFCREVRDFYPEDLVSIILYGSAASGEFVQEHSNLNLLIVLNNTRLENLKLASNLINKWQFRMIHPLFFSEEYLKGSSDVFPIEFLDMKENYTLLYGKDVLAEISVDTKNLRFQCEQELKSKLISLRQQYLKKNKDKVFLKQLLIKSFTSIMHILRNVLRLKGRKPPYLKPDILKYVALEFEIRKDIWGKILAEKNKQKRLANAEIDELFVGFVKDLENIVNSVDRL